MIQVNENLCSHCGNCVSVCPADIFAMPESGEKEAAVALDEYRCIACGHCLAACPTKAIINTFVTQKFNLDPDEPVIKAVKNEIDFMSLLKSSHSVRNFTAAVPPAEDITKILDVVAYTPSAHNSHQVAVEVLKKGILYDRISKAADSGFRNYFSMATSSVLRPILKVVWPSFIEEMDALKDLFELDSQGLKTGFNRFTYEAPILLIVHAPKSAAMSSVDAVLAAGNMMHAAHAMGYGTLFLGFIQYRLSTSTRFHRALGIPKKNRVFAVISVGYPEVTYSWYLNKKQR